MNQQEIGTLTFEEIDRFNGIIVPDQDQTAGFPLESWYRSIRQRRIREFSIGDLSRACRQVLHAEHVLPVAIEQLEQNPLAGEQFDGELLVALKSIPRDFWTSHQELAGRLERTIELHRETIKSEPDIADDAKELLTLISH
jgi:hypothetical protein